MLYILALLLLFQQPTPVAVTPVAREALVRLWYNRMSLGDDVICLRGYADMSDSTIVISSVYTKRRCHVEADDSLIGALYITEGVDMDNTEDRVLGRAEPALKSSNPRFLLAGAMHGVIPVTGPNGTRHESPVLWVAYRFPAQRVKVSGGAPGV